MTNYQTVFDPVLSELFAQLNPASRQNTEHNPVCARDLFYLLNQSAYKSALIPLAYDFLFQQLSATDSLYKAIRFDDYTEQNLASLQLDSLAALPDGLNNQDNLNRCVIQFAPVLLSQPCWLQNFNQISHCQSNLAIQLMSIYNKITGRHNDYYHALLLDIGYQIPLLHSNLYCQQQSIKTEIFDFAATQLALARFPRVLFAEILGFTLAYCQTLNLVEYCFPSYPLKAPFFAQYSEVIHKQSVLVRDCITAYVNQFPDNQHRVWLRIQQGIWLYQYHMQRCRNSFITLLETPVSAQAQLLELIKKKAVAALGHHHNVQLDGKPLDVWFSEFPENSQAFIQALRQSNYIDTNNPADSSLFKLFEFKGPMFGVLNADELAVLKEGLMKELNTRLKSHPVAGEKTTVQRLPDLYDTVKVEKLSNRTLYHKLLNKELFPQVLPIAKNQLLKKLRICAYFNSAPFKHYSHQQFDTLIEKNYQQEMAAYQPLQGQPKTSKVAYVWGIEQIAPMILIDGCWLQYSQEIEQVNPEIAAILLAIYQDEIGNGELQQSHPYIFQQLLHSLSINVPPVHTIEFIKHSGFIKSAFDLPTYMLALSNFPIQFLPELLGLNMAIELSGLGKGYMRLVDEWTYWGIDSTIADIHISIDNYATGHTFLAKKAIQIYLDDVLYRTGSEVEMNKHWLRIYNGYASLRFVGARFASILPASYVLNKFLLLSRN